MISRKIFVKICTEAILQTRKNISITNQLSGYLKFHKEIKENNYFKKARFQMKHYQKNNGYSLSFQHELLKKIKMGNCHEVADYLAFEILQELHKYDNVKAELSIIKSTVLDHVFLHIKIQFKDEKSTSIWEVDAWDPRIIDVSQRPNKTIKNQEVLEYGTSHRLLFSTSLKKFKNEKKRKFLLIEKIPEPIEGSPKDPTPERKIHIKHKHLFSDYTFEEACKKRKLDEDGEIHYLQRASDWQKMNLNRWGL